jgi:chromosome segregation protein
LEDEKANRQDQVQQLEIDKEQKTKELQLKQVDLEQLQQHHNKTKDQILQTQEVLEGLRSRQAEENRKLDSKKNEHDLLKSLIDSMEGYPESVKFLHNNTGWNHKAPILSDIIYVKEEFRAAVENVLEPYLNYYVVNNLAEGLKAVHLLDDNKKGKANFFLLDKINDSVILAPDHKPAGTIPALDVIEVDEQFRKLAEQLLGSVFIADDETALENSNGFVVLEKHGKYVKGSFTLTGGSVGLFEGRKIGRAKNLEKLVEQIQAQQQVTDELLTQIQSRHNEVIAFNADLKEHAIRQTEQEIQQLHNQVFGLQNKLENLHHSQGLAQNRIEELQEQLDATHASIENVRQELTVLNENLNSFTQQLQQAESAYQDIELQYNEVNTQYNNLNLQVTREQSKIAALKQELQFKNNQLTDLKNEVSVNTTQLKETLENIATSQDNLKGVEEGLYEMLRKKDEEEHVLNEADQAYYNLRNQLNAKESELRHKVKEKEQVEHLLTAIKDRLNEVKLQLAGMK